MFFKKFLMLFLNFFKGFSKEDFLNLTCLPESVIMAGKFILCSKQGKCFKRIKNEILFLKCLKQEIYKCTLFIVKAYSLVPLGKKLDTMKIFTISPNDVNHSTHLLSTAQTEEANVKGKILPVMALVKGLRSNY